MTVDDDVDCQVPSVGILPWFFFCRNWVLGIKTENQCISWKSWVFLPPLPLTGVCGHLPDEGPPSLRQRPTV